MVRWARIGQPREHRDEADEQQAHDRREHRYDEFRRVCRLEWKHHQSRQQDEDRDAKRRLERDRVQLMDPQELGGGLTLAQRDVARDRPSAR